MQQGENDPLTGLSSGSGNFNFDETSRSAEVNKIFKTLKVPMRRLSIIHMPKLFRLSIVKLNTTSANGFPSLMILFQLWLIAQINFAETTGATCVAVLAIVLFRICSRKFGTAYAFLLKAVQAS